MRLGYALPLQAKLLRAIETRKIQRVGGKSEIELNLRLICATHQNIEKKIDEGHFRADLFYRINVFPIEIPSLSERREDIPILVNHILDELKKVVHLYLKLIHQASKHCRNMYGQEM